MNGYYTWCRGFFMYVIFSWIYWCQKVGESNFQWGG